MAEPRERQAAWFYGQRVRVTAAHVVEQGCELLGAAVGETLRPARVALPVDEAAERWCDAVAEEPFVLMAPSAGWGAKEWPAERFGTVAAALGSARVQDFGECCLCRGTRTRRMWWRRVEVLRRAVPCSIAQLIALTRRAALVIAGGYGAAASGGRLWRGRWWGCMGRRTLLGDGPYGTRSCVLRHESSVTDHSRVAESGLLGIGVDEVMAAATECFHFHS